MPLRYDKMGIDFQYPDNWNLDEDEAAKGHESVAVYSPGGAFWSVAIHPRTTDPEELAKTALAAMQEEYPGLESEPTSDRLCALEVTGYEMSFYYLDLISTATVRILQTSRASYTIFYQAEDRDFDRLLPVFRAITASLVAKLG
jgi:hypothetical protein